MPTYNQAKYIGEAIQSVLDQTYTYWELIVIDDGSTDSTDDIVANFNDPRIRYVFQTNQGASEARNEGIARTTGEYIAFLDADDLYLPDKLQAQITHLDQNPEIGLTYGSRIEINERGNRVNLARLPAKASLETIVLGFPFAPTDLMVRRHWIEKTGGFSSSFVVNEDRDLYIRLVLAGCQCVGIEQFLSHRRLDTNKTFRDLPARLDDMLRALKTAFDDPRCPAEVRVLAELTHYNIYLSWAYQASIQEATSLAQTYFQKILHYEPSVLTSETKKLLSFLIHAATRDDGNHEARLRSVFAQLPPPMASLTRHCDWAIARGYLIRGMKNILWKRDAQGWEYLRQAIAMGAKVDEPFLRLLVEQLVNYETAFGPVAAHAAAQDVALSLQKVSTRADARWLQGCFAFNRALKNYRTGHYANVVPSALQAILHDPTYLANRGLVAVAVRSVISMLTVKIL
jgi:glycosyltransferase involved in cell wall biosynthesis